MLDRSTSQSVCGKGFKCVPYSKCRLDDQFLVLYPCTDTTVNTICCPENTKTSLPSRLAAFPEKCGDVLSDDRITGGERASVGQFPWMALLGYKRKLFGTTMTFSGNFISFYFTEGSIPFIQYLCSGSIITERFILTAAHCVHLSNALKL